MTAAHCSSVRFFQILRVSGFKPPVRRTSLWPKIPAVLLCLAGAAVAEVSGDFTYTDEGTTITITGYLSTNTGEVVIPDTIVSKPVTSIGTYAFYNCLTITSVTIPSSVTSIGANAFYSCRGLARVTIPPSVTSIGAGAFYTCTGLTSVDIPSSVTSIAGGLFYSCSGLKTVMIPSSVISIGSQAFQYCGALTSISVDGANPNFSSLNGVLFNKQQTMLLNFPAGLGGFYVVPASVTAIGTRAFHFCTKLAGVTIPPNLTSIGSLAFYNCSALQHANFTGNAPTLVAGAFDLAAAAFAVYYLNDSTGFTSPWYGYSTVNMGANDTSSTAWLLSKGLPANTDIQSDSNGDGVKLLMARALNLDPHRNLSGEMPQPVIAGNQMTLSFYAGAARLKYVVESSADLVSWSSENVTRSGTAENQTATVNLSGPCCYMRFGVETTE